MRGATFALDKQYFNENRISRIQCGISVGPDHSPKKKLILFFHNILVYTFLLSTYYKLSENLSSCQGGYWPGRLTASLAKKFSVKL